MESSEFKQFMSRVPTCVSVVASFHQGKVQACTISSFISVDVEIPTSLITLRNGSRTLDAIVDYKYYSASFLSRDQVDVAKTFSGKLSIPPTKLDSLFSKDDRFLSPHLQECLQICFCKLERVVKLENSSLLFGSVVGLSLKSDINPLVYSSRVYNELSPLP